MIRSVAGLAALLVLPLVMVGCEVDDDGAPETEAQPAEEGMVDLAAEEQAIRDRVEAWQAAANESAEAFSAFYTADGVIMPPNGPAAEGPAAIAEAMGPMFSTVDSIDFEVVDIDVAASGDLAVERGRYTLSGTGPDGAAFDDEGKYLVAWEKQGDEWMVAYDIFNSDRPAPGGE